MADQPVRLDRMRQRAEAAEQMLAEESAKVTAPLEQLMEPGGP